MQRTGITCRFRKTLDADLIAATENLTNGELSELVRNGLRLMLGIRTVRKVEVHERMLVIPVAKEKTNAGNPASAMVNLPKNLNIRQE